MYRRQILLGLAVSLLWCVPAAAGAQSKAGAAPAGVVRIAFIDPLSGPFAAVGANQLKHFQFAAETVNARELAGTGLKLEVVPFDNKASPQDTLTVLRQVIDKGIRFVTQGNGSGAALALIDAIDKHNERNPAQSILYLNYSAVDPDLTNSKCSFWHFRFDANTDMKLDALTTYLKGQPQVKRVYLINQNYSHGQQVSRVAREQLAAKRPDIKIVGDDLLPLGQVRDFSPYIGKMRAAQADAVITGNWGPDLSLLVRAARDAALPASFYTYYGGVIGTPTAIGAAGENRMVIVGYWHPNIVPDYPGDALRAEFQRRFNEPFYTIAAFSSLSMLAESIKRAKSIDPLRVAYAMEGLKLKGVQGEIEMRAADHQLQQPLWIAAWTRVGGAQRNDVEKTGFTWKTQAEFPSAAIAPPFNCAMKRPPPPPR